MKTLRKWTVSGRAASGRDVAEALALARQHKARLAREGGEARKLERDARAVAAAIRRQNNLSIGCRALFVKGRNDGSRRLRRFERLLGLALPRRLGGAGGGGGPSSFHFKLTPRGLGKRGASGRSYRRGEIARAIRYILREAAREIAQGGISSNLSHDPDELASIFSALEELEMMAGRDNANVYASLVVSLPFELDAIERLNVLHEICRYLDERGIGHVGVLHAPGPEGDQRNFHAHILYSWRPMALFTEGYAFSASTSGAQNTPAFVTAFRAHAADVMNDAMARGGYSRRFTAEKTRTDPGSSVKDKKGAGRKHAERRAEALDQARATRERLREREAALSSIIAAVKRMVMHPRIDHDAIIEGIERRNREIVGETSRAAAAALPAEPTPPVMLSHEKPAVASAAETPPSTDPAISHDAPAAPRSDEKRMASSMTPPSKPVTAPGAAERLPGRPGFATGDVPSGVEQRSRSDELSAIEALGSERVDVVPITRPAIQDPGNVVTETATAISKTPNPIARDPDRVTADATRQTADVREEAVAPEEASAKPAQRAKRDQWPEARELARDYARTGPRSSKKTKIPAPVKGPVDPVIPEQQAPAAATVKAGEPPEQSVHVDVREFEHVDVQRKQDPSIDVRAVARARSADKVGPETPKSEDPAAVIGELDGRMLPVRSERFEDDGGAERTRFMLEPEQAMSDEDAALFRRANALADAEAMQAFLHAQFEFLLERVRERLSGATLGTTLRDTIAAIPDVEPAERCAMEAAIESPEFVAFFNEAKKDEERAFANLSALAHQGGRSFGRK